MLNGIFSLKNPQSNEILQACQTYWRTETPTCKFSPGSTLSSHLGPCFIAAFNPAHDAAASCDECGKEGTVVFFFFPTLKEEDEEEEGGCDPGRQSRWHPRLSGLFKEHCRRGPESDKPTTQPEMISKLPLPLSTPKTSRFNTFSELQIAAHSRVT